VREGFAGVDRDVEDPTGRRSLLFLVQLACRSMSPTGVQSGQAGARTFSSALPTPLMNPAGRTDRVLIHVAEIGMRRSELGEVTCHEAPACRRAGADRGTEAPEVGRSARTGLAG
jgi:hypothetical protein